MYFNVISFIFPINFTCLFVGGWMARDVGYVVFKGYRPGVYESWNECEAQINGFDGSVMQVLCKIFLTILYAPFYGSNWLLL